LSSLFPVSRSIRECREARHWNFAALGEGRLLRWVTMCVRPCPEGGRGAEHWLPEVEIKIRAIMLMNDATAAAGARGDRRGPANGGVAGRGSRVADGGPLRRRDRPHCRIGLGLRRCDVAGSREVVPGPATPPANQGSAWWGGKGGDPRNPGYWLASKSPAVGAPSASPAESVPG
jgi:hypothetical protein